MRSLRLSFPGLLSAAPREICSGVARQKRIVRSVIKHYSPWVKVLTPHPGPLLFEGRRGVVCSSKHFDEHF